MERPSVKSKEVDQVFGLVPRERWSRLDVAPFLAVYAVWAAVLAERISRAGLESFYLYQLATYALGALHALAYLGSIWSVELRSRLQFRPARSMEAATHVKVTPHAFSGSKDIVPLSRKALSGRQVAEFSFRKLRFALDEEGVFRELQYPVKHPFAWYRAQSGLPEAEVARARAAFGANAFEIPIPSFRALLKEQLLAPFFCFQVFCVGLWALDEYWYYSLFTLLMLVSFECTVVAQRLRNLKDVRRLQAARRPAMALRGGRWVRVPGEELVPGDLVSICRAGPKEVDKGGKGNKGGGGEASVSPAASSNLVLQADMLLLAGTAIVDESVLTGESTPAWKSPVGDSAEDVADASESPDEARLVIRRDKAHVLFGATTLLQAVPDPAARLATPDGGCLALVLRTGFGTAQGRLMRTILYSTETVSANNAETFFFILFLLVWAVAASAYVLYHGLQDPDRDRFKLVLNCIMILTSVIPPELPMELTIAVNASLLALSRKRVFCTEPFRIPLAGHVTTCCFDKTGTLTSDQFLLEGVAGVEGLPGVPRLEEEEQGKKTEGKKTEGEKTEGNRQESGDVQPLSGGGFSQGPTRVTPDPSLLSNPRAFPLATARVLACCQSLAKVDGELVGDPLEKVAVERLGWTLKGDSLSPPTGGADASLEILHRFHFSSALQRMSVVVRGREGNRACFLALTKGSPEALRPLLAAPPPDYAACYARHASQGARVLALAWRALETEPTHSEVRRLARSEVEQGLHFAGFVVFRSPLKPESEPTLRALRESAHELLVITGDAALTACHAARAVHVLSRPQCLILEVEDEGGLEGGLEGGEDRDASGNGDKDALPGGDQRYACTLGSAPKAAWVSPDRSVSLPFSCSPDAASAARALSEEHDLCLTGASLRFLQAQSAHAALPAYVCAARVFARVAPEHKELVVRLLRASGRSVLMCGDGTNDVGALKAAHVGVAILAPPEKKAGPGQVAGAGGSGGGAGTGGALGSAAGAGASTPASGGAAGAPMRASTLHPPGPGTKMLEDLRAKNRPITPFVLRMAAAMDAMAAGAAAQGDEAGMVKPGDASMAAPFTVKAASVGPVLDVLRQGRSTLVTTVQMFKILGLLCLSTAYSLSVMYMDGIKLGDMQATLSGVLTAGMFFFISHAKPLERLAPQRPHGRVFSPYVFTSLLGQFAVHIAFLALVQRWAHVAMPPEERQLPDAEFAPNLINTVCFLVNFVVQTITFAVNYAGEPFATPLRENALFFRSVKWAALSYVALVLDIPPGVRTWFSLVPIPAAMQAVLLGGAAAVYFLTLAIERAARNAFPPPTVQQLIREQSKRQK